MCVSSDRLRPTKRAIAVWAVALCLVLTPANAAAQAAAERLDSLLQWRLAVARFRDAEAEIAAPQLEQMLNSPGTASFSGAERARILTFLAIVRRDLKDDTSAVQALRQSFASSLAVWPDSNLFSVGRRDFVRRVRSASHLPGAISLRATSLGTVIDVRDESGGALDGQLLMTRPGSPPVQVQQRTALAEGFTEGAYDIEVRGRLDAIGFSAPLVLPVRVTVDRGDTSTVGPPPLWPELEPDSRRIRARNGSTKALGWVVGGSAVAAGAFGGSRCQQQWDVGVEAFKGYAASCGGWIGTAAAGLLYFIGAHSFLNPARERGIPDVAARQRNVQKVDAYTASRLRHQAAVDSARRRVRVLLSPISEMRRP